MLLPSRRSNTPQTRRQQLNRVRSAPTKEVISIEVTNINVNNGLEKRTSGQARTYKGDLCVLKCYHVNSVLCRIDGR